MPNISVKDIDGDILLISQFTLHAATKKGNRPSYIKASKPEVAIPLYEKMIGQLEADLGKKIFTGKFGADMKVSLLNDGPVTIFIDTKNNFAVEEDFGYLPRLSLAGAIDQPALLVEQVVPATQAGSRQRH